jgi:cyclopropane-fatty-acyl-phospholipid synthase
VSSIEMGEHVGQQHYEGTAPGGGPFIEAYIAPDMRMRPLWQTIRHLESGGFEIRGVEAMRELYLVGGHLAFGQGRMGVDQIVARKP